MAGVQYPIDPAVAASDPNLGQAGLDYSTNMQALQWRQELAKSLLADSEKPLSSGIGARGMAYRVSPWEGLARMVSGGAGAYVGQQNVEEAKMLANKYGKAVLGTLNPGSQQQPPANPMAPNGGFKPSDPAQTAPQPVSAVDFLKKQEGFSPNAYADFKQNSIGYGTKARPGERSITPQDAEARLREEAGKVDSFINDNVKRPLTEGQRTALVSFGYNLGTGKGGLADLMPDINAGNWQGAADKMGRYVHAGGQVNYGLINRRNEEMRLLLAQEEPKPIQDRLMPPAQPGGPAQQTVANPFQQGAPTAPQPMPAAGPVVQPQPQAGTTAPGTFGRPIWSITGVPDAAAHALWVKDTAKWAEMAAASLRANSPTDIQKSIQHLPAAQQQMILTAHANQAAGLVDPKTGLQTAYGPNGPVQAPIPGATQAKSELASAEAAAKKAGEESGGYPADLNKRAENASGILRSTSELRNLNQNPGLFAGVKEDVGKFFRSMGASDETIQKYLKVSPGNLEASQKLTAQMAIETVKQISARPTQMEFQKFLEANPNIFQTPEGFKRVTQFLENAANDTIHEQGAFLQAKRAGLQPHQYGDFPAMYNQQRAEAIRAGQFNSTAPSGAPAAPPPPPTPAAPVTKIINGQTYTNIGGQWFHGGVQ